MYSFASFEVKGGAKLSLPVPIAVEKKAAEPKKEAPVDRAQHKEGGMMGVGIL